MSFLGKKTSESFLIQKFKFRVAGEKQKYSRYQQNRSVSIKTRSQTPKFKTENKTENGSCEKYEIKHKFEVKQEQIFDSQNQKSASREGGKRKKTNQEKETGKQGTQKRKSRVSYLETYFTRCVSLLVTPSLYAISVCKLKKIPNFFLKKKS